LTLYLEMLISLFSLLPHYSSLYVLNRFTLTSVANLLVNIVCLEVCGSELGCYVWFWLFIFLGMVFSLLVARFWIPKAPMSPEMRSILLILCLKRYRKGACLFLFSSLNVIYINEYLSYEVIKQLIEKCYNNHSTCSVTSS